MINMLDGDGAAFEDNNMETGAAASHELKRASKYDHAAALNRSCLGSR